MVDKDIDAESGELCRRTDPRQHQELGCVDSTCRDYHFFRRVKGELGRWNIEYRCQLLKGIENSACIHVDDCATSTPQKIGSPV